METGVMQAVAQYVEDILGKEGFRYVSAVVANCKMLALQLEEQEEGGEDTSNLDMDALVIAAYLHDISSVAHGFHDHHLKSAEMAEEFLRELDVSDRHISKVKQAILLSSAPQCRLRGAFFMMRISLAA